MHTIDAVLKALLQTTRSEGKQERNRQIFFDWHIWELSTKRTLSELAKRHGISSPRPKHILENQTKKLLLSLGEPNTVETNQLLKIFDAIEKLLRDHYYLLEHDRFAHKLVEAGLCSQPILIQGIIDLAKSLELENRLELRVEEINNISYVIHKASLKTLGKERIEKIGDEARTIANVMGGVFPYRALLEEDVCQVIQDPTQRQGFVRNLLEGRGDCFTLGEGNFYGFRTNSKLDTTLQKIFSAYPDGVPVNNLIHAVSRPIKKSIQSKSNNQKSVDILYQCQGVMDEYCLAMEFYSKKDELIRFREQAVEKPETKMFASEWKMLKILRGNGRPMPSADFVPLMGDYKSHFITYPILFYRKGPKKNSAYFTLDGRYNDASSVQEKINADLSAYHDEESSLMEGGKTQRLVNYYERKLKLRVRAIQHHGTICAICGFNFEEFYGLHGKDYIEIHHLIPVSSMIDKIEVDPQIDMIAVCANCHRMFHRTRENILSPTDLRKKLTILPFVVCIKSSKPKSITTGKVYQVLEEREELDEVFIVNDRGEKGWCHGDHFINIDLPESKAKYLTEV